MLPGIAMLLAAKPAAAGGGATPEFVGATAATISAGTSGFTVTPHASTGVGDLLVVVMYTDGSAGVIDEPSGWTRISYTGSLDAYLFHRVHDGSESYAFTRSVSTLEILRTCVTFSTAAFDTSESSAVSFSATPAGPSVTPSADALILLSWSSTTADTASALPADFTAITAPVSGGAAEEIGYSDALYDGGAPTGSLAASANYGSSRLWRAVTIAVIGA